MILRSPKNQNSLNKFLNNYFNVVLTIGVILFLVVAYFVILAPKYQATSASIKDNITQKQNLYNAQKKKLANLRAINNIYQKINPTDLKKFSNVLSDNYVKESLFGEIEDIVNQNGFVLNAIRISRPEEGDKNAAAGAGADEKIATSTPISPNLGEIDINLSLSTIDYLGFKNLIKIFETNLRLMDISTVSFSASDNSAEIALRTYYYQKK